MDVRKVRGLKLRSAIAFVIRFTESPLQRGDVVLNVYYREREEAPLPNSAHSQQSRGNRLSLVSARRNFGG
jgi:hypothetical protein